MNESSFSLDGEMAKWFPSIVYFYDENASHKGDWEMLLVLFLSESD